MLAYQVSFDSKNIYILIRVMIPVFAVIVLTAAPVVALGAK